MFIKTQDHWDKARNRLVAYWNHKTTGFHQFKRVGISSYLMICRSFTLNTCIVSQHGKERWRELHEKLPILHNTLLGSYRQHQNVTCYAKLSAIPEIFLWKTGLLHHLYSETELIITSAYCQFLNAIGWMSWRWILRSKLNWMNVWPL